MIDEISVRRWYEVFHTENPLTEIRILTKGRKGAYSGYFTDVETLLHALRAFDGGGIYAPFNPIAEGCGGREQAGRMILGASATTGDNDIVGRDWLLIDLDPKRPSGTNATDEEKTHAKELMVKIGSFLRDQGFASPIVVDSGNGYHLYYKVAIANTPEMAQLISAFLNALDMLFSNEFVEVDTSVFNASRIAKIPGTWSNKGSNTEARPQRMCKFVKVPDELRSTDIHYVREVAKMLPEVEKPSYANGYSVGSFDVDGFIAKFGIEVEKETSYRDGRKLILKECPFNANHKAPDSALFVSRSGAVGFKCLHNSCAHYGWRDFRLHFDPDAYTRKEREDYRTERDRKSTAPRPSPTIQEESAEKGHKWQSLKDIKWVDPTTMTFIATGITQLDRKIGGLALGDVTIVSGLAGAGKSSLLNNVILEACQHGYKVAAWSGELQASRFQAWIDQAAAGRNFVRPKAGYENWYYCPRDISDKINSWLDGKFFLYNNEYGSQWSQLFSDVKECVKVNGTQLVVLDNLMSMNLDAYSGEKNEKQTQFINDLKTFAKSANISVVLVAHPRKEQMNALLRMESISGTFDLVNLVDNILLLHRVGRDFERRATDFFGSEVASHFKEYDEVIEVAKNRFQGVKDFLVGLYFEPSSRRFLNDPLEYKVYGWQDPEPPPSAEVAYGDFGAFSADTEAWEDDGDLPMG